MFSPLKRALAAETDLVSRLDPGRVSSAGWTSMYIRAREQAFRSSNMLNSWKATGLVPLSAFTVLEKLQAPQPLQASEPCISTLHHGLDLSLLQSDPPDSTELQEANALCIAKIENANDVPLPVKRYISRLT